MLKKIVLFFFLLSTLFLISCGSSDKTDTSFSVKFGSYVLDLPNDFVLSVADNDLYKDLNVLYVYKEKKVKNNFVSSLIIGEYKGTFPSDSNIFFSSILDKIKKNIVGSVIFDNGNFSIDNTLVYYVKYKVDDNLFDNSNENIYYGFQVYILDKTNKKIYIISYISLEEDKLNDIFSYIENLKINK